MNDYARGFDAAKIEMLGYLDRALAWAAAMPTDSDAIAIQRVLPPLRAEIYALQPRHGV